MTYIISLIFFFLSSISIDKPINEDILMTDDYKVARCAAVSLLSHDSIVTSFEELDPEDRILIVITKKMSDYWVEQAYNRNIPIDLIVELYQGYIETIDTDDFVADADSIYAKDFLYCLVNTDPEEEDDYSI